MLSALRLRAPELLHALRSRIPKLPDRAGSAPGPGRVSLRPWIILITGLATGLLGYVTVSRESREGWLLAHFPPRTLWERTLQERGFRSVTDERKLIAMQGELPFLHPGSPRVWILENRRAVYLVSGQDPLFFSLGSAHPPAFVRADWEAIGFGWDAYETLLGLSLPSWAPSGVLHRVKVSPLPRDPREIRY